MRPSPARDRAIAAIEALADQERAEIDARATMTPAEAMADMERCAIRDVGGFFAAANGMLARNRRETVEMLAWLADPDRYEQPMAAE